MAAVAGGRAAGRGGRPRHARAGRRTRGGRAAAGGFEGTEAAAPSMRELREQLRDAVEREDYALAARLRDELGAMGGEAVSAVEEANAAFYRAFEAMSLSDMERVWGFGDHVQCIHPGSGCIAGRDDVLASWHAVFAPAVAGAPGLQISITDLRVRVADTMACVTCVERVDAAETGGKLAATNVFEYDGDTGLWLMTLHHASPCP